MKKIKTLALRLALCGLFGIVLMGCSENPYTPTTSLATVPGNGLGTYPNTGAYPNNYVNNYNPGTYANGYNNGYNSQSIINSPPTITTNPWLLQRYSSCNSGCGANVNLQAQFMWTPRVCTNPVYYIPRYTTSNCDVLRTVRDTPTSCGCHSRATHCDCASELDFQREVERYREARRAQAKKKHRTCITCTVTEEDEETPASTTSTSTATTEEATPVPAPDRSKLKIEVDIKNADAKALFERLGREEVLNYGLPARIGHNYYCWILSTTADRKDANNYRCALQINYSDGSIYQRSPTGAVADAVIANIANYNYEGDLVNIGGLSGSGLGAPEGKIFLNRALSSDIYEKGLDATKIIAHPGYVGVDHKTAAEIKITDGVRCFKTTLTSKPDYQCEIKIDSKLGEVLAPDPI